MLSRRSDSFANKVVVAGVGFSEISRDSGKSEGYLTLQATMAAIADAGIQSRDIEGVTTFRIG